MSSYIVRPITLKDFEAFQKLAFHAGLGITSLPKDPQLLQQKLNDSLEAFSEKRRDPHTILYLFIMEDLETGNVVGTCGIRAKTGTPDPLYFYRFETLEHPSQNPHVPKKMTVFKPVAYNDGPTEVCGLYLLPDYRKAGAGRLLSLSRFLFMACHQNRFDHTVFADMRGYFDQNLQNPFWEAVGRHFFDVPIEKALDMASHSRRFVAEALPRYPIYLSLLPKEVQSIIGTTHPNTKAALKMLQDEGFKISQEFSVFDGGPKIEAPLKEIRTIKESQTGIIHDIQPNLSSPPILISTTGLNFRATIGKLTLSPNNQIILDTETAKALQAQKGDTLRLRGFHPLEPPLKGP